MSLCIFLYKNINVANYFLDKLWGERLKMLHRAFKKCQVGHDKENRNR